MSCLKSRALKLVQSLDPPGVAARTLDECLRIQLENLPRTRRGAPLRSRSRTT